MDIGDMRNALNVINGMADKYRALAADNETFAQSNTVIAGMYEATSDQLRKDIVHATQAAARQQFRKNHGIGAMNE